MRRVGRHRIELSRASILCKVSAQTGGPGGRDTAGPLAVRKLPQHRCVRTHVDTVDGHDRDFPKGSGFLERIKQGFVRLTGASPRATASDAELDRECVFLGRLPAALLAKLCERGPASNDGLELGRFAALGADCCWAVGKEGQVPVHREECTGIIGTFRVHRCGGGG